MFASAAGHIHVVKVLVLAMLEVHVESLGVTELQQPAIKSNPGTDGLTTAAAAAASAID